MRLPEHLAQQQNTPPPATSPPRDDSPSSVVRTLTAQMAALNQQHRDEVRHLRQALETAQGEIPELRRRLGRRRATVPLSPSSNGDTP